MGGLSRVPRNAVNHHIVAESDRHPIDLNSRLRIDRFLVREVGKVDGPRLTALRLARLHAPPPRRSERWNAGENPAILKQFVNLCG
ncbi:hypothetical protein CHELA17_61092 [Chelatococcus asaccharovorans]|nr:hypothetical protein CHELA17_61092 [Chelatococcus asaccharovorans]